MTKKEFINFLAKKMEIPVSQAEISFNAVVKGLTHLLMQDDELMISGFGKFSVVHKPARPGRHPTTGQTIEGKAKTFPHFKGGDALKLNVANAVKSNPDKNKKLKNKSKIAK